MGVLNRLKTRLSGIPEDHYVYLRILLLNNIYVINTLENRYGKNVMKELSYGIYKLKKDIYAYKVFYKDEELFFYLGNIEKNSNVLIDKVFRYELDLELENAEDNTSKIINYINNNKEKILNEKDIFDKIALWIILGYYSSINEELEINKIFTLNTYLLNDSVYYRNDIDKTEQAMLDDFKKLNLL